MDDIAASTNSALASSRPKQAACLVCRKSKIRCDWSPDEKDGEEARCKRCVQLDVECVRPALQTGRQKGIKNKRKGLEKALYQLEQALRRGEADEKSIQHLHHLLGTNTGHHSASGSNSNSNGRKRRYTDDGNDSSGGDEDDDEDESPESRGYLTQQQQHREGSLTIDDAENPLQLLARASNLQLSPAAPPNGPSPGESSTRSHRRKQSRLRVESERDDTQSYFTSIRVNLDVGEDVDPIDLGLVTESEAEELFEYFHKHLAHTRWGLDPLIFTLPFTRSRSSFLTTSILSGAALFRPSPSAVALSKRLYNHAKLLAQRVITKRHKSVEIILAFLLMVPWMHPGEHSTDDETCWYVSAATTIGIDLSVHKLLISGDETGGGAEAVARGDCVDPRTALALDGFPSVDPTSPMGRRLLRRRERCWIALFVLERGMSLARGRSFTVPITRLLRDCDKWHLSDIADKQDGPLVSMAVLRRDLDGVFATVRAMCDGSQTTHYSSGSLIAKSIQSTIERTFEQWHAAWDSTIAVSTTTTPPSTSSAPASVSYKLPPYVDILVTHTRLSIYSGVINHPTAPVEVRQLFRAAGMSSALTVLRVAIQGEGRLRSMPNNTAIMITFAACFALTLSAYASDDSSLGIGVRGLIEEAADVLERVGNITVQRNGLSALYGRYLRRIVKRAAIASKDYLPHDTPSTSADNHNNVPTHQTPQQHHPHHQATPYQTHHPLSSISPSSSSMGPPPPLNPHVHDQQQQHQQQMWHHHNHAHNQLQFSTMSDEQLVDFLNQPDNAFLGAGGGLSWEDMDNFEGVSWPNMPGFGFG